MYVPGSWITELGNGNREGDSEDQRRNNPANEVR
jgi:hypothetical protein